MFLGYYGLMIEPEIKLRNNNRILIFSTAYLPMVGGAEVAIKEITDRLGGEWEFEMITARLDDKLLREEKIGAVLVHRIGFGTQFDKLLVPFLGAFKVWQINEVRPVSIFWAVMVSYASGAAYIYNLLKFWKKIPIVLTLQEGDSEEHIKKRHFGLIGLAWKLALSRSNVVTVISNYLAKRARAFGYKGEIRVIPNGITLALFGVSFRKPQKLSVRRELGFSEDDAIIVTTSRLVLKNAVGDIVKALAYLPKSVKFLSIGDGPLGESLKQLAWEYKVSERIVWKEFISNEELPRMLSVGNVFVRPSLSEGLGISFLEAMAMSIPVVATAVGGIPDFLKDPSVNSERVATGLFCEPNNPASIAEKVTIFLANQNLRKQIVKNAKNLIVSNYTWERVIGLMREVFENNFGHE